MLEAERERVEREKWGGEEEPERNDPTHKTSPTLHETLSEPIVRVLPPPQAQRPSCSCRRTVGVSSSSSRQRMARGSTRLFRELDPLTAALYDGKAGAVTLRCSAIGGPAPEERRGPKDGGDVEQSGDALRRRRDEMES